VKLSIKLGGQAGGQPKICGGHGPPKTPLEPPLNTPVYAYPLFKEQCVPQGQWCIEEQCVPQGQWCVKEQRVPQGQWCVKEQRAPQGQWCISKIFSL